MQTTGAALLGVSRWCAGLAGIAYLLSWSAWPDLNRRPLRPEANARGRLPPLLPCLTCLAPSVDVRWRPLVAVAVVTHLVTRHEGAVLAVTGYDMSYGRLGDAWCRAAAHRTSQSAARRGSLRRRSWDDPCPGPARLLPVLACRCVQGFHPTVCGLPGAREW